MGHPNSMEKPTTTMKGTQEERGSPPRPQFFKILLPGFSHTMTIPRAFNKYIAGEMQEAATIVSPFGRSWSVGVHRAANFFYFAEGWQKFSEAHGLSVGCFLVFRYEGEMVFTVTVFDPTTCMRDYGPAEGGHVELNPSESPRQQMCLLSRDFQNHNLNLANTCTEGSQFEINISSCNPCEEPYLPLPQEFVKYVSEADNRMATILSPIGNPWHVKVNEDSRGFHFADGWQKFAVVHNLRRGDSLVFKHKGALIFYVTIFDNGICKTEHNVNVESGVANGRIPTEEENSDKGLEKPPTFLSGKRVDEKMEPTTGEHQSVKMKVVTEDRTSEAPYVGHGTVRRPHFEVVINFSKHYRKYALGMPTDFMASNGLPKTKLWFLRDPNGHLWPVRLSHTGRGGSTIYSGWRDFCVSNNLQDGDVCLFELKKKNQLHVKIHRRRCMKSMKALKDKDANGTANRLLHSQTAAELVNSGNPHQKVPKLVNTSTPGSQFTTIISPRNRFGKATVNIPRPFLSSVDLSSVRRIILLDPKARRWPVNVYHREANMKHTAAIGYGWKAFCTSNNVEVGDKCIFKLASKRNDDVFHVKIIKQAGAACPCMPSH